MVVYCPIQNTSCHHYTSPGLSDSKFLKYSFSKMLNLPTFLLATAIFQFSLSIFIYFIFRSLNQCAKFYWLIGSIFSAMSLILRAFASDLDPAAILFAGTSFSVMGLIFLYLSLEVLFALKTPLGMTSIKRSRSLFFGLLIYFSSSQGLLVYFGFYTLAIINLSLTLGGINYLLYLFTKSIKDNVKNTYFPIFTNISFLIAIFWLIRAGIIIYLFHGDILGIGALRSTQGIPDPNFNFIFFGLLVALSSLRQAVFAGILIAQVEHEKQNLVSQQLVLESIVHEKTALLKTISTTYKASNLGMMISSLSHELNQPLGSMRITVDILKKKFHTENDSELLKQLIRNLDKDNTRASNIILRIKTLFQKGQDQFSQINFSGAVNDAMSDLSKNIQDQQIHFSAQIEPNILVLADINQIQMVLLNLMNNAIQSVMTQAMPRIIRVSLASQDGFSKFVIEDNGVGVLPEAYSQIFELFYTTKKDGSGIGLWLTRTIMEHHQGFITVGKSDLGGALFTLTLPRS